MYRPNEPETPGWRARLHEIIFEADTTAGKLFDVLLLWAIIASVVLMMLETVADIQLHYKRWIQIGEWAFTILFTIEYILRLATVRSPWRYARSFFGIVDLLAVLPAYLSLYFTGSYYLTVVRVLRLLRAFRIFKLARYLGAAEVLLLAMRAARPKIIVFLGAVSTIIVIVGTIMYIVEGPANGFTSIPVGIYYAVVTLTTVGYGDITPQTAIGKAIASMVMLLGYGIIAVPTGIVTAEIAVAMRDHGQVSTQACPDCGQEGHAGDAKHCKHCGALLHP
ncbi:MAG: ion transporter [Spirochaetales bacterium]|nr:ion transporter [Spirochaetales bacterium]